MAKIEMAYCIPLKKIMDASEANELWLEGVLNSQDKRNFECIDENCHARIVCANMDKTIKGRKVNPYFRLFSKNEKHSPECKVGKEYTDKDNSGIIGVKSSTRGTINKLICFHLKRPSDQSDRKKKTDDKEDNIVATKEEKRQALLRNSGNYKSNSYWLMSLVGKFIQSYRKNTLDKDQVEIDFGNGHKYTYSFSEIFKRIKDTEILKLKDSNKYIYYGVAHVYHEYDGSYHIKYDEKFRDSDNEVRAKIDSKLIQKNEVGTTAAKKILDGLTQCHDEQLVFLFANHKTWKGEKHSIEYLNVNSLSLIASANNDLDDESIDDNED